MSIQSIMFNIMASKSDKKRDAAIPLPKGVAICADIRYAPHGKEGLLDVYYPEGTTEKLPTIVSIHGGGYVYGSKAIYQRYCMDLARRGFTVVNLNFRLAPRNRFPAPLEDTNAVMHWICANGEMYHMDTDKIFLVGDSAGAQLASQYGAIYSNPRYASLFGLSVPPIHLRALGLNCGLYDTSKFVSFPRKSLERDYLGNKIPANDPRLFVLDAIDSKYPPAHITTASHDFLKGNAEPMYRLLMEKGIDTQWKCYERPDGGELGHVFHVNILLPEAVACNDEQCDFFRRYL
jgi:acetyl esterase/lipase